MLKIKYVIGILGITLVSDLMANSPELVVNNGEYIIIGAGNLTSSISSKAKSRLITDHLISFDNKHHHHQDLVLHIHDLYIHPPVENSGAAVGLLDEQHGEYRL